MQCICNFVRILFGGFITTLIGHLRLATTIASFFLSSIAALADTDNWTGFGSTNRWSDSANWAVHLPMNGDSLLFNSSSRTSILADFSSLSANDPNANNPQAPLTLQAINFGAAAPSYTIELYSDAVGGVVYNANLAFSGSGVTNASGQTQTFVVDASTTGEAPTAPNSTITFNNSAAAGDATYMLKGGEAVRLNPQPGILRSAPAAVFFRNNSSASSGTFISNGGAGNGATGARVEFHGTSTPGAGNSTAGVATFMNRAGRLGPNFNSDPPVAGSGGETIFFDNTTAGTAHFTNEAEADKTGGGGVTLFQGNANADHAVFVSNASPSSSGTGGETSFAGSARAGFGTFTNNASATSLSPTGGGLTTFFDTASADHGSFTNAGGDAVGGLTYFRDLSTAGNGTFTNFGTTGSFGAAIPGETRFLDNSNAGNGTFTNKPGTSNGGLTEFFSSSSAAQGTFINDSTGGGSAAGMVIFHDASTAANGQFSTQGNGGQFIFKDSSTAGSAAFTIGTDTGANARLEFRNQSTAASATIDVRQRSSLLFFDTSNGANSIITVRAAVEGGIVGGGGGLVAVIGNVGSAPSLGDATVDAQGGTVSNGGGGQVAIENIGATAGNAIITANGGIVAFSLGATTAFYSGATAGNATLIANGGSNGGGGGTTFFTGGATGGTARLITNAGGLADFSGNLNYGTSVGSIEGAGTYILGGSLLTTGSRNTDTVVSGTIVDGPGLTRGGQLTKVGTGKLTLAGTNTYSGLTTIAAGTLAVNGSIAGPARVNGGATLSGTGQIFGSVTVDAGGILAPGNSPGTLTTGALSLDHNSVLNFELGGVSDKVVVNGNLALDGVINIIDGGGLKPGTYEIFDYTGTLTNNGFRIGSVPAGFSPSDFILTAVQVPEPASSWLLLSIIPIVWWLKRLKSSRAF